MREERRIINKKLYAYTNTIDKLNTDISMYDILIDDLKNPLKAQTVSDMPKGGNTSSTTESAVMLRERYNEQIINYVQEKENTLLEFNEYIKQLEYQLQQVLKCRHIKCMNNNEIACKLNYSIKHVEYLIGQAQDILFNQQKHKGL